MMDAPVPQFLPHDPGQGTAVGFGNVRQPQLRGVQLIAGAQGHDEGDPQPPGGLRQVQLAAHQIDGVHNVVVPAALREKPCPAFCAVKGLHGVQYRVGVDVGNAPGHRLRLGHPHGGGQGFQLAVQIGEGHRVAVHQRQFADAGAGQTFGSIAADTPQAEHDDVGLGQPGLGLRAP
mgnify:CR=1 FL=1